MVNTLSTPQAIGQGWSPLRVGASCRMHADIAVALNIGEMDPDADSTPAEMMAAVAAAKAVPASLGLPAELGICPITTKMVIAATRGWGPRRHLLHHVLVRKAVHATLLVSQRLVRRNDAERVAAENSCHGVGTGAGDVSASADSEAAEVSDQELAAMEQLPLLPPELWIFIMGFFQRSWWDVKKLAGVQRVMYAI